MIMPLLDVVVAYSTRLSRYSWLRHNGKPTYIRLIVLEITFNIISHTLTSVHSVEIKELEQRLLRTRPRE
jgi:hypothetical protein